MIFPGRVLLPSAVVAVMARARMEFGGVVTGGLLELDPELEEATLDDEFTGPALGSSTKLTLINALLWMLLKV